MPLLDDARTRLQIDRESLAVAREMHQLAQEHSKILADAEDRAERLARLGDRERPKAEAWVQRMADAAALLPPRGSPGGGTAPPAARSSGGGGAPGAGGGGGGRISGPRSLVSQRGGFRQSEEFVREHCALIPGGVEVPNPSNPLALAQNDMVTIPAWDCSAALGVPEAIFLDPDAVQALLLPAPRSSSSTGGGGRRYSGNPNAGAAKYNSVFQGSSSGAAVSPPPSAPTADGKLVEKTLRDGFGALIKELRAGGDLGLQIRRNGGL